MRSGILYLVSGPSGSGKSTLCRRLTAEGEARFSVSCTTRAPRPGETHGREYYFLTPDEFAAKVGAGEFLEHAEVHGNRYGTLRAEVIEHLALGRDVVMDIDVQGAAQVRACADPTIRQALVDLFVMPPDEAELETRLRGRGTDSDEVIALRLHNAIGEMRHWPDYRFRLLSGSHEEDYAKFKSLLIGERLRVSRLSAD
ncbi:MAG: guanylate kinase [Verrucomicrobia bacterium]|nr:MAG: guanylate kinase [Verrucomicrobiota bacterium]TAE88511.1 MAG: guanylate kinase [Verrucomicrobiota bacterium]TAF26966.1 MAG: guanylate kinase [Verrucomicrobiota bacterium]TAF42223.1 MAG: guanylate kinase [Verrucomicrobiota bacterium]